MLLIIILIITISGCSSSEIIDEIENGSENNNIMQESQLYEIQADPIDGYDFHWPYYLYVPKGINLNETTRILVEFTYKESLVGGQGGPIDQFPQLIVDMPILYDYDHPDFRKEWEGERYNQLSRSAFKLEGDLKRIDLQLLEMVEHAREKLKNELNLDTYHDIFIMGFSASGVFATNFTAIHPENVRALVCGGIISLILPRKELAGYTLNYHDGVNDFEDLTGKKFDRDSFNDVAKYFFVGELESIYTIDQDINLGKAILEIIDDDYRNPFKKVEEIYADENISAQFEIYKATAHEFRQEIIEDSIKFFKKNMAGENQEITSYEYADDDFTDKIERIDGVKILDVYWGQDPNLPEELSWIYDYDGGEDDNMVFATDVAFISENQLMDFINRADFRFILQAEEYEDVQLTPWDIEPGFYRYTNFLDKEYYGILLRVMPDGMELIDQSVEYTVKMSDEVKGNYEIADDIKVSPIY